MRTRGRKIPGLRVRSTRLVEAGSKEQHGTVCGLEPLNANEQLAQADGGRIILIDESANGHREMALTG